MPFRIGPWEVGLILLLVVIAIVILVVSGRLKNNRYLKSHSHGGASAPASENTSGQGSLAIVPREIEGWNWGAFLLNWIWSIGNNVWIGLLSLIPYAGIIMLVILGVKGNEWAWRYKRWDSVEHFRRTQRKWRDWGLGLLAIAAFIWLIIAMSQC